MAIEISVVIPSRRGPRLAFALEALSEQALAPERFEVIVVRDEQSGGAEPIAPGELRLVSLVAPGACGPTVKRNLGWRKAAAPIVAFTDDDCRPDPAWLQQILAAWQGDEDVVLQGTTVPDADEALLLHGLARSQRVDPPDPWFQGCNIAYPKGLLERLDGFDEDYYFGSEDTDLGARALAAGARHVAVGEAKVGHAVIARGLPGALRDAGRWPSLPLLLRRHPRYRDQVFGRVFWRQSHAYLLLAIAGALAARRSRFAPALCAVPYLAHAIDPAASTPRGLARQLLGIPSRAVLDLVEMIATVRSSLRCRSFLV